MCITVHIVGRVIVVVVVVVVVVVAPAGTLHVNTCSAVNT